MEPVNNTLQSDSYAMHKYMHVDLRFCEAIGQIQHIVLVVCRLRQLIIQLWILHVKASQY